MRARLMIGVDAVMPLARTRDPNNAAVTVAVLGDAYCDFVYGGLKTMPLPGFPEVCQDFEMRAAGSAGYTSMGLAALGIPVEIIAQVGEDPLSVFWLEQIRGGGVGTRHVKAVASQLIGTSTVILLPEERSFISFYGANAEPFCSLAALTPIAYRLFFVTGFMQVPGLWGPQALTLLIKLCRIARSCGVPILFDTNYDSSAAAVQAVKAVLPFVDIFLPNALELKLLSGISDVERACTTIGVPTVVVKLGKAGCFVHSYLMGCSGYIETIANDWPRDLNGAGDFWAAGFIMGILRTGNLMDAARFGNEVASMAIDCTKLTEKLKRIEMLGIVGYP